MTHIATLEEQVQRLTEASTIWQVRARQAEDQLKQLAAGDIVPENATEAVESPPANDRGASGVWIWWRRLWRS